MSRGRGRPWPRRLAIPMDTTRTAQQAHDAMVRRKLEAAGVRPTRQRLDLACAIFGAGNRHFTAEMIYQETRSVRYAPTLGTIYNTLNEFARCGLLREIGSTTPSFGTTPRPGRITTSMTRTRRSSPTFPRNGCPSSKSPPRRHADLGDRRDRAAEEALTTAHRHVRLLPFCPGARRCHLLGANMDNTRRPVQWEAAPPSVLEARAAASATHAGPLPGR